MNARNCFSVEAVVSAAKRFEYLSSVSAPSVWLRLLAETDFADCRRRLVLLTMRFDGTSWNNRGHQLRLV
jgi:hypothetical protein